MASRWARKFAWVWPVLALTLLPNQAKAGEISDSVDASRTPGPLVSPAPGALVSPVPGYADLIDLLEPAPLVLLVQVRKLAQVEPERAKDLRTGWARIYVEARGIREDQARELIETADRLCPYSNAVRGNVDVRLHVAAS